MNGKLAAAAVMAAAVLLARPAGASLGFCDVRYCEAAEPGKPAAGSLKRHRRHRHARRARATRPAPVSRPARAATFDETWRLRAAPAVGGEARVVGQVRPGFVMIRAGSGATAIVEGAAAPRFVGFLRDLEATGYPVRDLGGFNRRRIAGSRAWSEHAKGRALDVNQEGRDEVSVEMDRAAVSAMAARNGLCSGGDWSRRPDLGHFEVCGSAGPALAAVR